MRIANLPLNNWLSLPQFRKNSSAWRTNSSSALTWVMTTNGTPTLTLIGISGRRTLPWTVTVFFCLNDLYCTIFKLMSYEEYQDVYRSTPLVILVVVVGDASVGKTSLIKSFENGPNFSSNPKPTVGVEYASKIIQLANNHIIKAQFWDTAGQ